jgi:hypothetical protein
VESSKVEGTKASKIAKAVGDFVKANLLVKLVIDPVSSRLHYLLYAAMQ